MRIAVAGIAKTPTWEALQADGWTDEQLTQLQQEWETNEFVTPMVRGLEVERAFNKTICEQVRQSNEDAARVASFHWQYALPNDNSWRRALEKEVYSRIWRFAWSHQDEQHYLEGMQMQIENARLAETDKSHLKFIALTERSEVETLSGGFYDGIRFLISGWLLPLSSNVLKRAMRAETDRGMVVSAIALKRYSISHGKYPASLDALVPEILSSVPTDYMDGKPIKYHLNADGTFTLYSVGEDGRDDGGDASLLPDKHSYRNLWDRKDFVWPAPATAEETAAWRKEQAKN